ncbi:hypothetical protein [Gaoshiqia sediminis]|uniref:Uncharacterized protein n=1 Tax=Gaoshiqia sediminis TaxID=2986998 RepID=A0AA42CB88_9BACT|nr:hypothetical protein [Gaoshiqia sediminis]MCW0484655.1 hypothetical protein [Gaoshiqia sediminis]
MADSAERFGNKGVAAFLNVIAASAQTLQAINDLLVALRTMSAVKQIADMADMAGSPEKLKLIQDTIAATNQLTGVTQTLAATKQAADATELATAPGKIAANQAVATSEVVKSGAGVPFPGNILAIAAGIAAVVAAFASIAKFETGGIVGGSSFTGDKNLIRANSGEMILNYSQQRKLFNVLNGGTSGAGNEVIFKISGSELVGVLNKHSRKTKNIK